MPLLPKHWHGTQISPLETLRGWLLIFHQVVECISELRQSRQAELSVWTQAQVFVNFSDPQEAALRLLKYCHLRGDKSKNLLFSSECGGFQFSFVSIIWDRNFCWTLFISSLRVLVRTVMWEVFIDALLWVQHCAGCHEAINMKEIHGYCLNWHCS